MVCIKLTFLCLKPLFHQIAAVVDLWSENGASVVSKLRKRSLAPMQVSLRAARKIEENSTKSKEASLVSLQHISVFIELISNIIFTA